MTSDPRLVLLGGNKGFWHANDRLAESATMTGIESWAFACNGDYRQAIRCKKEDLANYDIIIASYNHSDTDKLIRLQEGRRKGCKWVTMIEADALTYIKPQQFMRELLDNSDLIICINRHTESFFKKFTTAKVVNLGLPYPAEGIRALSTPVKERRKEIFLAPMLLTRWTEYFCVRDLGVPFYGYEKRLSRTRKTIIKNLRKHGTVDPQFFFREARSLYNEPQLRIERETSLPNFFRYNGAASVWLNLDQRYTWARYVLDAAALQVPIITTHSTGHGEDFFPLTTIANEFEIDKAAELVKKLFSDADFYREVSTIPINKFDHLRPEVKKKELFDSLY